MKNEFTKKTRELFDMGGYYASWESGRNDADALHHILGRISNSPYNACPLNNAREHQPEGRKELAHLSDFNVRRKYLIKTKKYLDDINYSPTESDLNFLKQNKKYYD